MSSDPVGLAIVFTVVLSVTAVAWSAWPDPGGDTSGWSWLRRLARVTGWLLVVLGAVAVTTGIALAVGDAQPCSTGGGDCNNEPLTALAAARSRSPPGRS